MDFGDLQWAFLELVRTLLDVAASYSFDVTVFDTGRIADSC